MKNLFTTLAVAAVAAFGAQTADAEDWYLTLADGQDLQMLDLENGSFSIYIRELTPGFSIHNGSAADVHYGADGIVEPLKNYTMTEGKTFNFTEGVLYYEDVQIDIKPADLSFKMMSGTPMTEVPISYVRVAGTFNNWSLTDDAVLTREPGTQIYKGRIDFYTEGSDYAQWLVYTSKDDSQVWGLPAASTEQNQLTGTLKYGSDNRISSEAIEYDVTFNAATKMFELQKVFNPDEKMITVVPDPNVPDDKFNEFTLTFNGCKTATPDNAFLNPKTSAATFTDMATGKEIGKIFAQILPYIDNTVVIQSTQTIWNKAYLEEMGIEPGEEDNYPTYPNGKYVIDIPAGYITLDDGFMLMPSEAIQLVYTLGKEAAGIETLAPEYEGAAVYTLSGVRVLENADAAAVNALPRGLYVIKGRKIAVK